MHMQRKLQMTRKWGYCRHDWLYGLVLIALGLMVPLCVCMLLWLMPGATAADNWQVEGANGVLRVRGELTEGACRLDMTTAHQAVEVGETAAAKLAQPGDQGESANLQLRLYDCLRTPAATRDARSGNLLWSAHQPAVSVRFIAPADADNPQLIALKGTSGVGLRLTDERGRDIRLGERGTPLALAVGQNALNYRVTPERTRAPLRAGAYFAQMDFQLNYD